MKKILAIITLITMLFLAGCGSTEDTDKKSKNANLSKVTVTPTEYYSYKAIEQELGRKIIVDDPVISEEERNGVSQIMYTFTIDTTYCYLYYGDAIVGFGSYIILLFEDYEALQKYQNEMGKQIIYPTVKYQDRPKQERLKYNANIYYVTEESEASAFSPKLDENGRVIPNYWKYEEDNFPAALAAEYNSLRIEGEDGIEEDGKTYFYVYGRRVDGGIEVRVDRYEFEKWIEYYTGTDK